jgi:hypothetical protein
MPSAVVFERVVVGAQWSYVGGGGRAAVGVGAGVVEVAHHGGASAAGGDTAPVADLDVPGQRPADETGVGVGVQRGEQAVAVGVAAGQISDQRRPPGRGVGVGGQAVEVGGGDVQFDHSTVGLHPVGLRGLPGRRVGVVGSVVGGAGEQEVSGVVEDGEAPPGIALPGHDGAGEVGQDGSPAGDVAGSLIESEQGEQPDPDLDPCSRPTRA